ncbi:MULTISPECIES: hypothetical protein [unclassified Sporosarcina]|uniref:hypothetical protein n=1 Tax=unclassified Sporosarcina TaxID=2647733 RepID=UPI001A9210D1|nr:MULTISPECIES: hypothetical protein [unclassified Sporosarcina]MBO0587596.1 hypothetical protein [Sporosarcina sp. E16_8]MBO0602416.1 hypothetical protein [Sporosarcina sp. E16_3]
MDHKLQITRGNIESGENKIEIAITSTEKGHNEILFKAIESLIESIDLDVEGGETEIARILFSVADHIGFNGWYSHSPNVTIQYDEDSDEGFVTNQEKIGILRDYLKNFEQRL